MARKREISLIAQTSMLSRYDMLDVVPRIGVLLLKAAVFAALLSAFTNKSARSGVHLHFS